MEEKFKSIRYSRLAIILIAFIFGFITKLLIENSLANQVFSFSTVEIISFVLSVIIGGASIFLAITAILLSKSSEVEITRRNDESIKTQNELFQKTIETLNKIGSSTEVTEKRLDDIITGRVKNAANVLSSSETRDPQEIEETLRRSLSEKISPKKQIEIKKREEEIKKARENYNNIHESILLSLSNDPRIKSEKPCGHGHYGSKGDELFDGIFKIEDSRIGVSIFSYEKIINRSMIPNIGFFLMQISREIKKGHLNHFFLLSNKKSEDDHIENSFRNSISILKEDLENKIHTITGSNEHIIEGIMNIISKKS